MLIKGMILFLAVMAGLAIFGKLRLPIGKHGPRSGARCARCGRPKTGPGPCPCTQNKGT